MDLAMMRKLALMLVVVVSLLPLFGCSKADTAPASTADRERELQQQLDAARKAEGAAQKAR